MPAGSWEDVILPGRGTVRAWVPGPESEDTSRNGWMPVSTAAEILGKSFRAVTIMIGNGQLRGLQPAGHTKQKVMADDVYAYLQRNGREVESDEDRAIDEWHRTGRASQATLRMIERRQAAENSHWGIEARQPATPADNGVDPLAAYQARYAPEKR